MMMSEVSSWLNAASPPAGSSVEPTLGISSSPTHGTSLGSISEGKIAKHTFARLLLDVLILSACCVSRVTVKGSFKVCRRF